MLLVVLVVAPLVAPRFLASPLAPPRKGPFPLLARGASSAASERPFLLPPPMGAPEDEHALECAALQLVVVCSGTWGVTWGFRLSSAPVWGLAWA